MYGGFACEYVGVNFRNLFLPVIMLFITMTKDATTIIDIYTRCFRKIGNEYAARPENAGSREPS